MRRIFISRFAEKKNNPANNKRDAGQSKAKGNPRRWRSPEFWTALATVVIAVAAIFTFGTSVLTWWILSGQLDEMRQSFAADRAYIFLNGIVRDESKPIAPGYVITAHFKNFGRTPAIVTKLNMACKWFAAPPPLILPDGADATFSLVIGAGDPLGEFQNPVTASAAEIDQAKNGNGSIRCIWNVSYSDVRSNPHVRGICMFYDFPTRFLMFCREPQYRYTPD